MDNGGHLGSPFGLVPRGFVSDRLVDVRCWMDAKGLGGWGGGWRLAPLLRLTPLKHGEGGHPQGYLAVPRRRLVSVPVGVWRCTGAPRLQEEGGMDGEPSPSPSQFLVVGTAPLDWDSAMDNGGHLAWPFRGGSSWLVNVGCWMDARGEGGGGDSVHPGGWRTESTPSWPIVPARHRSTGKEAIPRPRRNSVMAFSFRSGQCV